MKYAKLENGHLVPLAYLQVGETWPTQWGPRKVVGHVHIPDGDASDNEPGEPEIWYHGK